MSMGKRKRGRQQGLWIAATDIPTSPGHPFYLGLVMRRLWGVGKPRGLQGLAGPVWGPISALIRRAGGLSWLLGLPEPQLADSRDLRQPAWAA
jgi:hypothetical protein